MSEATSEQAGEDRFEVELPEGDEQQSSDEPEFGEESSKQPDVYLDIPLVKVDEISLEVEDLRARVSLQAEVLDLLKLNVGVDAALGRVGLEIKGVEAQALLKVRLDNVAAILDRVLKTIDRNPQILEHVTRGLQSAAKSVGEGTGEAARQVGRGAGEAVEDIGKGTEEATKQVGRGAGEAVEDIGNTAAVADAEDENAGRPSNDDQGTQGPAEGSPRRDDHASKPTERRTSRLKRRDQTRRPRPAERGNQ